MGHVSNVGDKQCPPFDALLCAVLVESLCRLARAKMLRGASQAVKMRRERTCGGLEALGY